MMRDMNIGELKLYLEISYYISQIILVAIASYAVLYTRSQVRSYKEFEILRYLESKESRDARFIVLNEIKSLGSIAWWEHPDNKLLYKAASEVAAIYDVAYLMLQKENRDIREKFYRNWAGSITANHDVLNSFLAYRPTHPRTKEAYGGFTKLYNAVQRYTS